MSGANYAVILKGRPAPILLKAASLRLDGSELRLLQGGEVVAGGPDIEFAVHIDAIPGGEVGAANLLSEPPRPCSPVSVGSVELTAEPVRGLDPVETATYVTHNHWGAPVF